MTRPAILVIDNVDSFTFMLVDYLRSLGAEVAVVRNDDLTAGEAIDAGRDGIVISPGPGEPAGAGISVELAGLCMSASHPLLGVCLGHQAIGLAAGSVVQRAPPVHGKVGTVRHDGTGLFSGLPSPLAATRYHSLAIPDPLPPLVANAWSDDGVIMGMRHETAPVHGVQFHPESIGTAHGHDLLAAFLRICSEQA
ncbi:anthranilate synthase component II [Sphingomonas edaphi]|uniref:Aminodeoxychorismate/anthranilate synthase component II n=1 Tax=Sphingomonas edaphi TaxID=2315689 RepID=A0A418Q150_9SPHN|nr:aminodeoxychorismate/anthranilate synthase component II [Sphingomonas edaphi]RIX31746.1 aminodeoxychorismate/anthranilate synthase component II [Sphingomonas edaphi]